jgi:superfamily II DNA/RNA helicase
LTSFTDLGLSAPLLEALTSLGYEQPTPIQEEAVPACSADGT